MAGPSVPIVARPTRTDHWTCPRDPTPNGTHSILEHRCLTCGKTTYVLRQEQSDILNGISFEAIPAQISPEEEVWIGRYRVRGSEFRYCGHRHKTADAADACAARLARTKARRLR